MEKVVLTLIVRSAWWVLPYLYGIRLRCMLTGAEPNYQRVARVVERGMRIKTE